MAEPLKSIIFYIHGFRSSGLANKAKLLQEGFENVYSPSLPVSADLAIHLLENTIKFMKPFYNITLVGSSLGGYYSIYLANKHNLKAVLVNPSIYPYDTLRKCIGEVEDFTG